MLNKIFTFLDIMEFSTLVDIFYFEVYSISWKGYKEPDYIVALDRRGEKVNSWKSKNLTSVEFYYLLDINTFDDLHILYNENHGSYNRNYIIYND